LKIGVQTVVAVVAATLVAALAVIAAAAEVGAIEAAVEASGFVAAVQELQPATWPLPSAALVPLPLQGGLVPLHLQGGMVALVFEALALLVSVLQSLVPGAQILEPIVFLLDCTPFRLQKPGPRMHAQETACLTT